MEVRTFLINSYIAQENEKVPIIIKWLGCEEAMFVQTFNNNEQEKCKTSSGLFEVLSEKLKPQHNETVSSLRYSKQIREEKENAEEWMGHL